MRKSPSPGIVDRDRLALFRDFAGRCEGGRELPLEEQVAELRAVVQALCAEQAHQDDRRW